MLLLFLQVFTAAMAAAGVVYWTVALLAARAYQHRLLPPVPAQIPEVMVLKPLAGVEPGLEECLRSHLDQDYPSYSVVLGVAGEDDPALEAVDGLLREGEGRTGVMVVERRGPNGKIGTLVGMQEMLGMMAGSPTAGSPSILVINDADVGVPPDYLSKVVAAFGAYPSLGARGRAEPGTSRRKGAGTPEVGLVTCLYRGRRAGTLGSRLEALGIATDFIPGVLTARRIEGGLSFALGATMAVRADVLDRIGGLEPLLDYLADDYELGRRVRDAGYGIAVADVVVETHLPAYSWREFVQHQLRWARTIRASRPGGYAGLVFTHALFWSAGAVLAAGAAPWSLVLFSAAVLARVAAGGYVARRILDDDRSLRDLWLLPLRDLIAAAVWAGGYVGRKVVWRGRRFELRDGKLLPLDSEAEPAEEGFDDGSFEAKPFNESSTEFDEPPEDEEGTGRDAP